MFAEKLSSQFNLFNINKAYSFNQNENRFGEVVEAIVNMDEFKLIELFNKGYPCFD